MSSADCPNWNFGKNVRLEPEYFYRLRSADEVLSVLDKHRDKKFRVVGSLHAWSDAAESRGVVLELSGLNSIEVDLDSGVVKVGAGCKIKNLLARLATEGLTLPSIGLIDEQTVAGATATATHGSGKNSLSHYIEAVEIAHFDADSGHAVISRIDSGVELQAARCSIGLLGVVVSITFRCRAMYNIEEYAKAQPNLSAALASEPSHPQQQFYLMPWSWQYFVHHRVGTTKPRSSLATLYRWYCFVVIDVGLHVALYVLARLLRWKPAIRFFFKRVLPLTIVRNWNVVDDSRKMLTMEHELFRHIEIELFVQRSCLHEATEFLTDVLTWCSGDGEQCGQTTEARMAEADCLQHFNQLKGCYIHHYPICFRRVLCDDALISMSAVGCPRESNNIEPGEDWYAISLISYQWPGDRAGFFKFADFIGPAFAKLFSGRCHWGKYNPLDKNTNEQIYPQIDDFRAVVDKFDRHRSFCNEWLEHVLLS